MNESLQRCKNNLCMEKKGEKSLEENAYLLIFYFIILTVQGGGIKLSVQ